MNVRRSSQKQIPCAEVLFLTPFSPIILLIQRHLLPPLPISSRIMQIYQSKVAPFGIPDAFPHQLLPLRKKPQKAFMTRPSHAEQMQLNTL